jgi:hypothetical protein
MTVPCKLAIAASGMILALFSAAACHQPAAKAPAVRSAEKTGNLKLDQQNVEGWTEAWTNLVNDSEQSFTPTIPRLEAVDVMLLVGNPGAAKDQLTLTVLGPSGKVLVNVDKTVFEKDCDQVRFMLPDGGIELTPGQLYRIRLTGGLTFGWKYVEDGYAGGEATFNGKPLLPGSRSSFLFRTFGPQ